MTVIGYARVSTDDQDLSLQIEALKAAGCTLVRGEKLSGTSRDGRAELAMLLEFSRAGDTLVVTRVDRLARSVADLQEIVTILRRKGVMLRALEQPIDTSTSAGKVFFDMLGVFAEFESSLRRERQLDGISRAKDRGGYRGRKPTVDADQILQLKANGAGATSIARQLEIARTTVYRTLRKIS